MNKLLILTLSAAAVLTACSKQDNEVASPDGKIKFAIDNNAEGLFYSVAEDGQQIIAPSRLGFVLAGNDSVARFDVIGVERSSHDDTWETVWGENR